jgi:hypothetical protein
VLGQPDNQDEAGTELGRFWMTKLEDLEALAKELAIVRRRGIARVEVIDPRLERLDLPILRYLTEMYDDQSLTFAQRLETLILDGIRGLTDDTDRETAFILFGFLEELPSGYKAKRLEDPSPDELREEALKLYGPMRVHSRGAWTWVSADCGQWR